MINSLKEILRHSLNFFPYPSSPNPLPKKYLNNGSPYQGEPTEESSIPIAISRSPSAYGTSPPKWENTVQTPFKKTVRLFLIPALAFTTWLTLSPSAAARLARLYSIQGEQVFLKRAVWSDFYTTYPRTMLYGDDLLRVSPGTVVTLLCPDRTESDNVRAGVSSVNEACPGTPRRLKPTFGISDTWTAQDSNIPYVITPWSGQVLTRTPVLRWNPVPGTRQYRVTLQRNTFDGWQPEWTVLTDQPALAYPVNKSPLVPGEEYALQVTAGWRAAASSEEWSAPAVFSVAGGQEARDIAADIAAVEAMDVPQAFKTLILVQEIYPTYKLFAQGINDLQKLIATGEASALAYRLLGDYAVRSGLALVAEDSYTQAVALAEAANELEERVKAQWGLGVVYNRTDRTNQAQAILELAHQGAKTLEDEDLLSSITAERNL
ncbi:MAG: tetratricopeptide repeat protein [Cyanobacteria bacterium P01_D01_bin.156]